MSSKGLIAVLALAVFVAVGAAAVIAQDTHSEEEMKAWMEAGAPGPHHAHFKDMVGTWDAEAKSWMAPGAEPMVTKSKSTMLSGLGDEQGVGL